MYVVFMGRWTGTLAIAEIGDATRLLACWLGFKSGPILIKFGIGPVVSFRICDSPDNLDFFDQLCYPTVTGV